MKCFRNPKTACVIEDNEDAKLCWACNYDPQIEASVNQRPIKKEVKE